MDTELSNYEKNQIDYERQKRRYGNGFKSNRKRVRRSLIKRDGNFCQMCKTKENLTIDHIEKKPPTERQDNRIGNLQLLCLNCHRIKDGQISKLLNEN